ncbi:hypothetical protein Q5424_02210 [Conexibacter sp. JD483]|uniref:alpha/beta hydrolase family protein n=1 Tax=unclassified Conexibacter TaxID=2627773 RepID=UPI0027239782|nr:MULTISPECIES: hypothetical protein [unclassified Conexibacter]MDO8185603.1 hypothetical protein [Conexibacter sp. CPCC 205706]MDO8198776.1 hypothetical protein [Conexibacter sp. CPCC 205762]MDR9367874.1 hypothetical protein [Conexibacter sp. JD483]
MSHSLLHRSHPAIAPKFGDDDFQFGFEIALGATYRGAADVGEVLATAERIKNGDADAWVREWSATAGAAWAAAGGAEQKGRRVSALSGYRRAATYYATALHAIARSSEAARRDEIWRRHRACWEKVVDLTPKPGERYAIAYEQTTLPGWFFPALDAQPGERRPTVVMVNGSDGATSQLWVHGGAAAAERGWHWTTFDGPGQQSALFEQGIPFRHDWEAVLTPVLDTLLQRPDVDPERIVVVGISQAGFWVPRALAFEHRFAAAVVDPGVTDVASSWIDPLPGSLRKELAEGKQQQFDRNMHVGELISPSTRAVLSFRGEPYGIGSDSRYELYRAVEAYRLGDEVGQIATPLLITDPEGEQFWPGQSQALLERLPGVAELVAFAAADGAGRHCEPLASAARDAVVFDWLEERLSR